MNGQDCGCEIWGRDSSAERICAFALDQWQHSFIYGDGLIFVDWFTVNNLQFAEFAFQSQAKMQVR